MADLSVVIVAFNTRDVLDRCLRALFRATPNIETEVIVVDNGSSDGTVEHLTQRYPEATLILNEGNVGFAAANNQGLDAASGQYVLLLNSDAFVNQQVIQRGLETLRQHPECGIAGVRLVNEDGTFQAGYGHFPSLWDDISSSVGLDQLARSRTAARLHVGPVDWIQGACMFVRKAAVDATGGLDSHYFMYSEEVDWCWQFRRHGWQVWYLGDVAVVHLGGGSSRRDEIGRRTALYDSRLSLRRRLGGPRASFLLWLVMLSGLAARIVVRAVASVIIRHDLGRQTPASDWQLLRAVSRMDPLARNAVS